MKASTNTAIVATTTAIERKKVPGFMASFLRGQLEERKNLLALLIQDNLAAHLWQHVAHRFQVEPLSGDFRSFLVLCEDGDKGSGVALGFVDPFLGVALGLRD